MKDAAHHLRHVQRKIIRSSRQETLNNNHNNYQKVVINGSKNSEMIQPLQRASGVYS